MEISLNLSYSNKFYGTFEPEKVLEKISQKFSAVIEPYDFSLKEVQDVITYLLENNVEKEQRNEMLSQITGKFFRNGPTFRFRILIGNKYINGWERRYNIGFASEESIEDSIKKQLIDFLEDIKLGIPELKILE